MDKAKLVSILIGVGLVPFGIVLAVTWNLFAGLRWGREYTISYQMAVLGYIEPGVIVLYTASVMLLLVFAAHFWWGMRL